MMYLAGGIICWGVQLQQHRLVAAAGKGEQRGVRGVKPLAIACNVLGIGRTIGE